MLADWITLHSAGRIRSGVKVWLFRRTNNEGPLVGYGSLGTGDIDVTVADGSKKTMKGFEIEALALHRDYWGFPKGATDPEDKFSCQIVRHLQQEARKAQSQGKRERILALYVHPDAIQAQNLYTYCGFTFAPGRFMSLPEIPPEEGPGLLGMDYMWAAEEASRPG
jgi:ribosomal protein S18 acetylase RimI-like enzyme